MAMMASAQPIVKNTFWDLELDGTQESDEIPFPRLRRSSSDFFIDYVNLDHEVVVIPDYKVEGSKVEGSDSSTKADTSDAGSEAGSDDRRLWSEMMSTTPAVLSASCQDNGINESQKTWPQTVPAPPDVFEEVQKMRNNEANRVKQTMRLQTASAKPVRALAVDCSSPPVATTPAFRVGMQVEVFSVSEDRWLPATVSTVTVTSNVIGACKVPAGSVCVLYAANSKAKWITPKAATSILRKPQEVPMEIPVVNCGGKVPGHGQTAGLHTTGVQKVSPHAWMAL